MNVRPAFLIDADESISKAMSEIVKSGTSVIVTKKGRYFGIIDDRDVRQSTLDPVKTKCGSICVSAPFLTPQNSLLEICNAFFGVRHKALPLIDGEKIRGIVTRADVINALLVEGVLKKIKISEIMSSPAIAIEEDESIAKAKELMRKNNVRRLVVTKKGMLRGVISTYDLAALYSKPRERESLMGDNVHLDSLPVSSFMREDVETASAEEALVDAAKKMVERDISAIIVEEKGKPIGMVTARDIFETVIRRAKEPPRVFVSGLEGEDTQYYPEIKKEGERMLKRLGKSFYVESLSLHVKRYERRYAIRARLRGKQLISVSAFAWTLPLALKYIKNELKNVMRKRKLNPMHQAAERRKEREAQRSLYGRGQVSVEMLFLVGVIIVMLVPVLVMVFMKVNESNERLAISQANIAAAKLAHLADAVNVSGDGASIIAEIQVPDYTESISIGGREIIFKMNTSQGMNEIVKTTRTGLKSKDIVVKPGRYYAEVKANRTEGAVLIDLYQY